MEISWEKNGRESEVWNQVFVWFHVDVHGRLFRWGIRYEKFQYSSFFFKTLECVLLNHKTKIQSKSSELCRQCKRFNWLESIWRSESIEGLSSFWVDKHSIHESNSVNLWWWAIQRRRKTGQVFGTIRQFKSQDFGLGSSLIVFRIYSLQINFNIN